MGSHIFKYCVQVIILSSVSVAAQNSQNCLIPTNNSPRGPHLVPLTAVPLEIINYIKIKYPFIVVENDLICATVQEYDKTVYLVQFTEWSLRQICTAKAELQRTEKYLIEIACLK